MNTVTTNKTKCALGALALALAIVLFAEISMANAAARVFTAEQREAIAEAKELRAAGDIAGAREVLENANIFRATYIHHRVPTEEQIAKFNAIKAAVENEDYAAFQAAAGDFLTSKIDTEADFDKLVEANELRE